MNSDQFSSLKLALKTTYWFSSCFRNFLQVNKSFTVQAQIVFHIKYCNIEKQLNTSTLFLFNVLQLRQFIIFPSQILLTLNLPQFDWQTQRDVGENNNIKGIYSSFINLTEALEFFQIMLAQEFWIESEFSTETRVLLTHVDELLNYEYNTFRCAIFMPQINEAICDLQVGLEYLLLSASVTELVGLTESNTSK